MKGTKPLSQAVASRRENRLFHWGIARATVSACRTASRGSVGSSVGQSVGLTAIQIKNAAPGRLSDGRGLILVKTSPTNGRWVYRYQLHGKRRDMGLGSWPMLSLADARKERDLWAREQAAGRDPISVRAAQVEAEKASRDKDDPTLADMTQLVFEARRDSLRGGGTRGRWLSPLTTHVLPKLGKRRMSEIHQTDIKTALSPIWRSKHPTAKKAIERLRIVFREARAVGVDCDPFVVDAAERLLGIVRHEPKHIASTPWQEIPALYARLNGRQSSHLCLRWMILTCVRADGCRGAHASEIDGDLWTVPADRIKGQEGRVRDFRVPLSPAAQELAQSLQGGPTDLLFPGDTGAPITTTALQKALNTLGEAGRPHGFRSSFRAWVQDTDAASYEVSETILGHKVGNKVERAYARSDLLDRRRTVMDAWARYVTGAEANVVTLRG